MRGSPLPALLIAAAVLTAAACGGASTVTGSSATSAAPSSSEPPTTATSAPVTQPAIWPAIWPAADVTFDTPEAAAKDFVTQVLGVPPVLGAFQQGDARSGEIEVFSPGEGGAGRSVVRGRLLLRQLGPRSGWFVISAVNENATITSPTANATVAPKPLVVEGRARGFEANVVVTAFTAGDRTAKLGRVITVGGALETPKPFAVTLDLSAARPGSTVVLLVRGGTGLETDPGEFGAIPVVIGP